MKYILLKVIERNIYHEYYCSNDLEFLNEMCNILNQKDDHFYFIVEMVKYE